MPADDPDDHGVRARQLLAVQLPGVVAEGASVDVAADVDAASAQSALSDEGIRLGRARSWRDGRAVPLPSLQTSAERQRVGERLVLLSVQPEQFEPGHLGGVLDFGAVPFELLERAR